MRKTPIVVAVILGVSTSAMAGPLAIDRPGPPSLAERDGGGAPLPLPAPKPANPWKPIFGVSLGLAIVATGFTFYAHDRSTDEAAKIMASSAFPYTITDADCGRITLSDPSDARHFSNACAWSRRSAIAVYGGLGVGVFTFVAAYFAFRDRPQDHGVAVTPTVTSDGAGAQLSLAW